MAIHVISSADESHKLTSDVLKVSSNISIGIFLSQCFDRRIMALAEASFKWALSTELAQRQ